MDWVTPQYSRSKIDAAGKELLKPPFFGESEEYDEALSIISNWRSAHSRPLYTFRFGLRRYAQEIDPNVVVAQRIKRLSSISLKLSLRNNMRLSQMQDIGGCRAVLNSLQAVQALHNRYKSSDIKHKLISVDDYIENPKSPGYRSLHLVYSYYSDRKNRTMG